MNHSSDGERALNHTDRRKTVWLTTIFIIIAATGLTYVKWWPYYDKALKAIMEHSIGSSILGMDPGDAAPSWQAAWNYALTYFKAVWKAAVLGILLGTLVQSLLPSPMAASGSWQNDLRQHGDWRNRLHSGHDVLLLRRHRSRSVCARKRYRSAPPSRSGSAIQPSIRQRSSS
ncbi:Uncharacterised protein [Actinobacillus pleuropneumoniae]|nr:Uncharacterised protein [Actinobacillus pleuropneumoniae]